MLPPFLPSSLPGGFDCILGNPPYLGGTYLSGTYGYPFCHYVKWEYAPAGLSDLVVYFVRRIYSLLHPGGFTAFITTNSIKDGDIRKDGLEQILAQGGSITFAVRGIKWPGRANLIVSLVSLHKGEWLRKRFLDGEEVDYVSAFFEGYADAGQPEPLSENDDRIFKGPFFLGDGFLLTHEEAETLKARNPRLCDVIFPVINGQELNNEPDQTPGRQIINFFDWPLERARQYSEACDRIERLVKPLRAKDNRQLYREKWWIYGENRPGLRAALSNLKSCFAVARTTKHLSFSLAPTNYVFTDATFVFTTDRWDLYAAVQSTIHEVWARKYSSALKQDLRYSPSKCFDTFPFPERLWQTANPTLAAIGERYHKHRRALMHRLWLGLTDIYNLFHARNLTSTLVAKISGKSEEANAGYEDLLELRALHQEMDKTVLAAYGWSDIDLAHDFYELEYLAENDRVRYTISPDARKEVLRRLLALNHERAAAQTSVTSSKKKTRRASTVDEPTNAEPELFS